MEDQGDEQTLGSRSDRSIEDDALMADFDNPHLQFTVVPPTIPPFPDHVAIASPALPPAAQNVSKRGGQRKTKSVRERY